MDLTTLLKGQSNRFAVQFLRSVATGLIVDLQRLGVYSQLFLSSEPRTHACLRHRFIFLYLMGKGGL